MQLFTMRCAGSRTMSSSDDECCIYVCVCVCLESRMAAPGFMEMGLAKATEKPQ
jgi:hypothetical protein